MACLVRTCGVTALLSCAATSNDDPIVAASTTDEAPIATTSGREPDDDEDTPATSTAPSPPDVGSTPDASESGATPTDGWFAATTRVIFYAHHYAEISAHGLAITDQLSSAPGLIDYSFDFDLQSGRAQSISLWETELDFWLFVGSAAHARAMVELNDPVAGRDFSYATWWVETEVLPTREDADAQLGPEPTPGPYPIE